MSSPGGETVSIYTNTGYRKPIISRKWLQTLDHTIEQKTPVFIQGVNDKATFTFYVNSLNKNGANTGLAEYTYSAWIAPYSINIIITDRRLYYTSLENFYIPFTISQLSHQVSHRIIMARPITEVPKGRTFIFNSCIIKASNALISLDTAPGVIIVNNFNKDITFQRKQKLGNIKECKEDEIYFSSI
ncbi:unnamed protein product [Fusarium fujikuroi]|uniref:Uncharacterized protein n=1 Tax=Fusarium fujikuroi TaxID=5127 RepID=A0A9Q9U7I0_FUSFU|nr:unnamed protein product [Fusarium fujikuroi]